MESKYVFLQKIEDGFSNFIKEYHNSPREKLARLMALDISTFPNEYNREDFYTLNQMLKADIAQRKYKLIKLCFPQMFKSLYKAIIKTNFSDFIRWFPTTILIVGFIKSLIISINLNIKLSFLFSFQDFLDYGISNSIMYIIFTIIFLLNGFQAFVIDSFVEIMYIGSSINKPSYSATSSSYFKKCVIIMSILSIIVIFTLNSLKPNWFVFLVSALIGFSALLIFSLFKLILIYSGKIFYSFSVICIVGALIYNLWIIPVNLTRTTPFSNSLEIINNSILPKNAFFVESTSKYQIFSTGTNIILIPTGEIQYKTNLK